MSLYLGYVLTVALLALSPGPDILLVISTALRSGFNAALRLVLGLSTGVIVHTLLIALGISVLLARLPLAMYAVAVFGSFYLLHLAWQTGVSMRRTAASEATIAAAPTRGEGMFWRGVVMNVSNPKVLLFFLAFFPQFARLDVPGYTARIVLLGFLFQLVTVVVFGGMAWLAAHSSARFFNRPAYRQTMDWLCIAVFTGIGALLLYSGVRRLISA